VNPDQEFTLVLKRTNNGWATIDSLRNVAALGMPYAKKIVEVQHTSLVSDLADAGELEKFIIGIKDADDLKKTADFVRDKLTEQMMKNASYSVDAASLVFAHTVLEDAINSYLGITRHFAQDFWKTWAKKRQFDLEAVMKHGLDDVVGRIIQNEIWSIRRNESLVKKAGLLLAICKPSATDTNYKFDGEQLKAIDKLRQDIVHGDLLGSEIADINTKLIYLRKTWIYFFTMLHETFGLRIDTTVLTSQPQATRGLGVQPEPE
jgi:hypothetical protein